MDLVFVDRTVAAAHQSRLCASVLVLQGAEEVEPRTAVATVRLPTSANGLAEVMATALRADEGGDAIVA